MYVLELAGQDDAFAAREAATAAEGVALLAPGLATATALTDRVAGLALTRRASALVDTCPPSIAAARERLADAAIEREGTVAVRAVDVRSTTGVDTQCAERALGAVLVERGFAVDLDDPDHELRALFAAGPQTATDRGEVPADSDGVCVLGWLAAEPARAFAPEPDARPFVQPGSMAPAEARAVVNLAGARAGRRIVDPMCGTGGLLAEAGLLGAAVVGLDAQWKMARGTRENLRAILGGGFDVARADATALPLADGAADAVVFDAPYGRQSKVAGDLDRVVAGALAEARRLAPRGALVADRDWSSAVREAGWTVERYERRVHRSLTRHVHVLRAGDGG